MLQYDIGEIFFHGKYEKLGDRALPDGYNMEKWKLLILLILLSLIPLGLLIFEKLRNERDLKRLRIRTP